MLLCLWWVPNSNSHRTRIHETHPQLLMYDTCSSFVHRYLLMKSSRIRNNPQSCLIHHYILNSSHPSSPVSAGESNRKFQKPHLSLFTNYILRLQTNPMICAAIQGIRAQHRLIQLFVCFSSSRTAKFDKKSTDKHSTEYIWATSENLLNILDLPSDTKFTWETRLTSHRSICSCSF
jgi:hypothetical protein